MRHIAKAYMPSYTCGGPPICVEEISLWVKAADAFQLPPSYSPAHYPYADLLHICRKEGRVVLPNVLLIFIKVDDGRTVLMYECVASMSALSISDWWPQSVMALWRTPCHFKASILQFSQCLSI